MDISAKRVMTNLAYYTLAFFVVLFSALFIAVMTKYAVPQWALIVYIVWAALAIITVLFDIIASMTGRNKLIIGFVVYGLMLLFFVVGFILYARLAIGGLIPAGSTALFTVLGLFSLLITIGLIFVYVLGLHKLRLERDIA